LGAASIFEGGCSDDGFAYFQGWLLLQGKEVFQAAIADPDSLAGYPTIPEMAECEDVLSVATEAYPTVTGEVMPANESDEVGVRRMRTEPTGQQGTEASLPRRFPKLWSRFSLQREV
jgi:Protein of unknown function (DUF4240)